MVSTHQEKRVVFVFVTVGKGDPFSGLEASQKPSRLLHFPNLER